MHSRNMHYCVCVLFIYTYNIVYLHRDDNIYNDNINTLERFKNSIRRNVIYDIYYNVIYYALLREIFSFYISVIAL